MNLTKNVNIISTILSILIIGVIVGYFWGGTGDVAKEKAKSITIQEYQNQFEEYKEIQLNMAGRKVMIVICIFSSAVFLVTFNGLKMIISKLLLLRSKQHTE